MSELYRTKIGMRDYKVAQPEKEEVIEKWKQGIDEIFQILSADKLERDKLEEFMRRDRGRGCRFGGKMDKIFGLAENKESSADDKRLLAIGLWIIVEVGDFSMFQSAIKVLKGGTFNLDSFLERKGNPNCIDTSVLTKVIAGWYGVEGNVKMVKDIDHSKQPNKRDLHHFFESSSGRVVDIWQLRESGGLGLDEQQFLRDRQDGKLLHSCVGKSKSIKQPS